jgi:dihydrofolate reductase
VIRFIAAVDRKLGMAKSGVQPWKIPADEKYFLDHTSKYGAEVLMGSKTFEVIGHPLKDRRNYVLSRTAAAVNGAEVVNDLDGFLKGFGRDLWVIGGASVFSQSLQYADELYLTHVEAEFGCDLFFPEYKDNFILLSEDDLMEDNGFIFRLAVYTRKT